MTNKYKIVVIEDNPKHLKDVRGLINKRQDLVKAVYTTNLADALYELDSRKHEGVLSDAHFPEHEGGPESPCGIQVIDYAMGHKMPFTIVTSDWHHGEKTEPISERSLCSGMEIIDDSRMGRFDHDIRTRYKKNHVIRTRYKKKWGDGLANLVYLIDKSREGKLSYAKLEDCDHDHIGMISSDDKYFESPDSEGNLIYYGQDSIRYPDLDKIKSKLRL